MYVSYDARKVMDALKEKGVTITDRLNLELQVGLYWPNHIIGVCEKLLKTDAAVAKANAGGWFGYFNTPVINLLSKRIPAHRTNQITAANCSDAVYKSVTGGLLVADFTMDELKLLLVDIPAMVQNDRLALTSAISACKDRGSRSVFYLHGVLKRGHATKAGMRKQRDEDMSAVKPWEPAADFEPLDVVDIALARAAQPDIMNDAKIAAALNKFKP